MNELFCGNGFKVLMSRFKKCMLSGVSGVFLRIRDGEPILFSEDVSGSGQRVWTPRISR